MLSEVLGTKKQNQEKNPPPQIDGLIHCLATGRRISKPNWKKNKQTNMTVYVTPTYNPEEYGITFWVVFDSRLRRTRRARRTWVPTFHDNLN